MNKIWCVSDTHGLHAQLSPPTDCDTIIVAGDMTNSRDKGRNYNELLDFLAWLSYLPNNFINRIVIAGNHDTCLETGMRSIMRESNITYLEHEAVEVDGIRIFGSPFTPTFGEGWAFNKNRAKLHQYWEVIPSNTQILVTHGPPKGILDLSHDKAHKLEYCGDKALLSRVKQLASLEYHIFGHIHNTEEGDLNQGTRTHSGLPCTFVNASCVTDGQFGKGPSSNGVVITL